jgi:hypothetical protein
VPTVELASWPLGAVLFDGDTTAGPCPVLFSEDPESSVAALEANPDKAHKDYSKVARSFFMPEYVKLKEALAVVKKPRYYAKKFSKHFIHKCCPHFTNYNRYHHKNLSNVLQFKNIFQFV